MTHFRLVIDDPLNTDAVKRVAKLLNKWSRIVWRPYPRITAVSCKKAMQSQRVFPQSARN